MRTTKLSSPRPIRSRRATRRALMSGRPRSASDMARPHRGRAGQAMAEASRRFVGLAPAPASVSRPAASRVACTAARSAGSMPVRTRSCSAVMMAFSPYFSTTSRKAFLATPFTRPFCTYTPQYSLPSPCSPHPR